MAALAFSSHNKHTKPFTNTATNQLNLNFLILPINSKPLNTNKFTGYLLVLPFHTTGNVLLVLQ